MSMSPIIPSAGAASPEDAVMADETASVEAPGSNMSPHETTHVDTKDVGDSIAASGDTNTNPNNVDPSLQRPANPSSNNTNVDEPAPPMIPK